MCRPWWRRPAGTPALPANHKHALRDLRVQLKSLASVPDSWGGCIRKRLDTVIEIQPRSAESNSSISGPHHGGTEDYVGTPTSQQERQEQQHQTLPPHIAAVPLSVGAFQGETLCVGVRIASKQLHSVGEAFLLGAEFLSFRGRQGKVTTVCFSPVTGRIFVRFATGSEGMAAQALPILGMARDPEIEIQEPEEVEAFMLVSATGNISFARRCIIGDKKGEVEWSGVLSPEFLPLSDELYASLTFQIDKLFDTAHISITWAGQKLPDFLTLPALHDEFDSIWFGYEW